MILDEQKCAEWLARQQKPRVNVGLWLWLFVLAFWSGLLLWGWLS